MSLPTDPVSILPLLEEKHKHLILSLNQPSNIYYLSDISHKTLRLLSDLHLVYFAKGIPLTHVYDSDEIFLTKLGHNVANLLKLENLIS
jgi:hypothetical protein